MEQREKAWWQEEAQQHDKQTWRCVEAPNYVDIETNNGAVGGDTAAGEGVSCDKGQWQQCVNTTDDDDDDDDNDDVFVPIFALYDCFFIVWLIVMG
jgi:hypothetical protein